MDIEAAVRAFKFAAGHDATDKYAADLLLRLLDEEHDEFVEAINMRDRVQIAKEVADIVYVAVSAALAFGIPFNETFAAVHNANMTKFDGEPEVDSNGKVLKGKNYRSAEDTIREILR